MKLQEGVLRADTVSDRPAGKVRLGKVMEPCVNLRERSAAETLAEARQWARRAGITRVTEITALDRIGYPVFAAIRPLASASPVSFGKGIRPIHAETGAFMEAIETFYAEPGAGAVATRWGDATCVAGAECRDDAILDFAPILNTRVDLQAPMLLAEAQEVENGHGALVPAELVFHPGPDVGAKVFGTSTNGLASGNSVLEATVHGLTEVIERDIWSFESVHSQSRLVRPESLPSRAQALKERIAAAALEVVVRDVPNPYGLAFFAAFLFDPQNPEPTFFNGGWGCHPLRGVALDQALSEAIQSRLAFIHGFRRLKPSAGGPTDDLARLRNSIRAATSPSRCCDYDEVATSPPAPGIREQLNLALKHLRRVTDMPVYRIVYTKPSDRLQVVRIVIPTLEHFSRDTMRVGRRLGAALSG